MINAVTNFADDEGAGEVLLPPTQSNDTNINSIIVMAEDAMMAHEWT